MHVPESDRSTKRLLRKKQMKLVRFSVGSGSKECIKGLTRYLGDKQEFDVVN